MTNSLNYIKYVTAVALCAVGSLKEAKAGNANAIADTGFNYNDANAVPQGSNPNFALGSNEGGAFKFSLASIQQFLNASAPLSLVLTVDPSNPANSPAPTSLSDFTNLQLHSFTKDFDEANMTGITFSNTGDKTLSGLTWQYGDGFLIATGTAINAAVNTAIASGTNLDTYIFSPNGKVNATIDTRESGNPAVISSVPEPGTLTLLAGGALALAAAASRKKQSENRIKSVNRADGQDSGRGVA